MSDGFNSVQLLGNLGADPELKTFSGGAVLKLRLATSRSYKDNDGVLQTQTDWHSASMFGKRAEALAPHLHKGDRVFLQGSLRTSSYEKDGEKRYVTEVNVDNLVFCGGKKDVSVDEPRSSGVDDAPFGTPAPKKQRKTFE